MISGTPIIWALEPKFEILVLMWSSGPLVEFGPSVYLLIMLQPTTLENLLRFKIECKVLWNVIIIEYHVT